MLSFLVSRLFQTVFVVLSVAVLVFVLIRLSGDPAALYLPEDASDKEIAAFRQEMGWDRPIPVQLLEFLQQLSRGDFGMSLRHREPAMKLVIERLPATLELTAVSILFALLLAIPAGVLSAVWRNSPFDGLARLVALIGLSIPNFWLGIMLILLFSVVFNLLPSFGRGGLEHLVLPSIALGFSAAGTIMRLIRSSVLEILSLDYVRTARAKGLAGYTVTVKHVLRNSAIPALTLIGLQLGYFLSGSVVTETVFAYPGVGRLAIQAIANRDFAVVQAFVIVAGPALRPCQPDCRYSLRRA